jgi:hypothetical protein
VADVSDEVREGERNALICLKAKPGDWSKFTLCGGRYADFETCGGRSSRLAFETRWDATRMGAYARYRRGWYVFVRHSRGPPPERRPIPTAATVSTHARVRHRGHGHGHREHDR